ncbi:MAG: chorismate synthase [Magnetovibrio sp.]|nr:chorismate synthase [Magnetovibrio sp.]
MSHNTFGHLFRVTTFGESHGSTLGCIVDGCPPGLHLNEGDIQPYLDQRKPGQSSFTTQRKEDDIIQIISGVFEGKTTGTPIGMIVKNIDQRSKDYSDIKDKFRPGHADYTYTRKYGFRDYRGGGRSSARETVMRVAAGAIARKILSDTIVIRGALIRMGKEQITRNNWDWDQINKNAFFCPDAEAADKFKSYLSDIRKSGSSVGGEIEIHASGVPAGWGAPIYGKLDADLAAAIMSINAVKGVEIGSGMATAHMTGEENADEIREKNNQPFFLSNNSGGILGGISTGQDIVIRFAVKPTSSILNSLKTIDKNGLETEIITKGRHDPCIGIRAVPIGEAMMACILADHMLRHRAQCG